MNLDLASDLVGMFDRINQHSFDGFLEAPVLRWNSRLRSSAGRFIPGRRKFLQHAPPIIEVASYLMEEAQAEDLIYDTMAHEMIHYWLWIRNKPYGHTPEFLAKMRAMGVSRYNQVPRTRSFKYLYKCPSCEKDFPAKRRLRALACANCCKRFSNGRFDRRFQLILHQTLTPQEALALRKPLQTAPQQS